MFGDSWRGVRGREGGLAVPRAATGGRVPGTGIGKSRLQQTVEFNQREAAKRFFSSSMPIESVQALRSPPSPVAAMNNMHFAGLGSVPAASGLGLVNVAACDSFEQAIESLGQALQRARGLNVSNAVFAQAQEVYDRETSLFLWRRTAVSPAPPWSNCEGQTARIAGLIDAVNAELQRLGGSPVVVPPSVREQQRDAKQGSGEVPTPEMDPVVKFAITGGIVVAGIIGLAVITGQVAPLLRVAKRVMP